MNARSHPTGRDPIALPVELRVRSFPATPPARVAQSSEFPERVLIADAVTDQGRAICGGYLGDGPEIGEIAGRFFGRDCSPDEAPNGRGPLRPHEEFLDRLVWRLLHQGHVGGVMWEPATFFASLAFAFRNDGRWAVLFAHSGDDGVARTNYFRPPIIFQPRSNGRVGVRFGPRKSPDARDFEASGRQYPGRFLCLKDAASSLSGERVDDLQVACRLFEIKPSRSGSDLDRRLHDLRALYRSIRTEADLWPGVSLERL